MSLMPFISHVILFKQTQTMMYLDTKLTYFSRLPWGKWEELGFSPKTVQNRSIVQAYTGLQSCPAMLLSSPLVWVQLSLLQMVWLTPMDTFWSELPLRPALEQWAGESPCLVQLRHLHGWPLGLAQYQCEQSLQCFPLIFHQQMGS